MIFTKWDYFIPTLGLLFVVLLLVLLGYICGFCRLAKRNTNIAKKLPAVLLASLFIFTITGVYTIPSVMQWGEMFSASRVTIVGVVEEVRSAGATPLYYDRANCTLTTPSYVTISGTDYYVLSAKGIGAGDTLAITCAPGGPVIESWEKVSSDAAVQAPSESETENVSHSEINKQGHGIISPTLFCAFIGMTLCALFAGRNRIAYSCVNTPEDNCCEIEGIVKPRKISVASCTLEFATSVFGVLSILTNRLEIIVVMFTISVCLWVLRLCVQRTLIGYGNDCFMYAAINRRHTYDISDVQKVFFFQSKQGYMILKIQLKNGTSIQLNQRHFCGLNQFYQWFLEHITKQ